MNLRCLFGFHDLAELQWRWVSLDSWYWFRRCVRCGYKRKLLDHHACPPSHWELNERGVYREVLD